MSSPRRPFVDAWPIVFTDLDGSLLDHYNYSHEPARETLDQLESTGVAVIPNTSKTLAELIDIRVELKNHSPFSIENGAAVYIPAGYFPKQPDNTRLFQYRGQDFWQYSAAKPREFWQNLIEVNCTDFASEFSTFGQLGVKGIVKTTGLSEAAATLANQRQFSEPVHWTGDNTTQAEFIQVLVDSGAQVLAGGRFLHVLDPSVSKAAALEWITQCYRDYGKRDQYLSIALGDSHNDISMLEAADVAALIRSPMHQPPTLNRTYPAIVSHEMGPSGWRAAIRQILDFK